MRSDKSVKDMPLYCTELRKVTAFEKLSRNEIRVPVTFSVYYIHIRKGEKKLSKYRIAVTEGSKVNLCPFMQYLHDKRLVY
jgi:hypothetical protein